MKIVSIIWVVTNFQCFVFSSDSLAVYGPTICAAYAACLLTRECNRRAYAKNRRSMTTSDMVGCIQESYEILFD